MDSELLRKVQLVQLGIAKDIKRICDENDITYFLCAGSLLGAVRHKGIIPWDDDMDMGILYEDYDRFLQIAQEKLGNGYFVQTMDTDPNYPYEFCKVQKVGTEYVEASYLYSNKRKGIFVDIFPYFNFPDDVSIQRKQSFRLRLYRRILLHQSGVLLKNQKGNIFRRISYRLFLSLETMISKIISREKAKKGYRDAIRLSQGKPGKARVAAGPSRYGIHVIPNRCFESFIEAEFEDTCFKIPREYDTFLKIQYGDYMKLPPIEKRGNWHNVIRVKI